MANQDTLHYIRRFSQIGAGDIGLVGGKGANLGEMTQAGLPVPPGFCLTADAYYAFIQLTQLGDTVQHLLAGMNMDSPEDVEGKAAQIRQLLIEQPVPKDIAAQVLTAYRVLTQEMEGEAAPGIAVAVRSSATAEDLPTASFAGQQDTYLNVRGDDDLLEHVRRCWASLWTARAITYRTKQKFDHMRVGLAVVVQAMIASEVSGILFTANPVNSRRDEVVVNASWGLGEAIVSGLVTPDTWIVRKRDHVILSREIATKSVAIEYTGEHGTAEIAVPADRRDIPALTEDQVVELVSLGIKIESHYVSPMDIEWGYWKTKFYVLQARAITTLQEPAALPPTGEYDRSMFLELLPDALSPAILSAIEPLFQTMLDYTFKKMGFTPPPGIKAIGVFYNQAYFHREYIEAVFQPFRPAVRERMVAQVIQPFGKHEGGLKIDWSIPFVRMIARLLQFMVRFPPHLPKIVARYRQEVKAVAAVPAERMSDREIMVRIRELVFGTVSRLLNYDYLMIELIHITYQMLGAWLQRYFGKESDEVRAKLVSGVTGNVTMETNKHMWDLAQSGKVSPTVRAVLRGGTDLRGKLEKTKEGQQFLAELDRFLAEYGHREVRMDILYPTWVDDPAPVLAIVRQYLDVPENQSPYRQQERLVKQREELARTVQTRVQQDLFGRLVLWPIFRWVLTHAQVLTRERDTMHFEFTRVFPPFRHLLLELGKRWTAQGFVTQPEDIFFLTLDEMTQVAESPRPMHETVAKRRAELAALSARAAPIKICDGVEVLPETRVPSETVEGQWRGIAGSPGMVKGIARVVRGPEEFDKLQNGDILVAPLTNPVWTPLFAIAGGLVTEVGGILSHGAIVAREYGIPAVMAVPDATHTLRDGQRLMVDGNQGVVYLATTDTA